MSYLGDSYGTNVLRVARSSVASAPEAGKDATDSFHTDAAVHSVNRWWLSSCQTGASIVIADALNRRRQDASQHSKDGRNAHRWNAPLPCARWATTQSIRNNSLNNLSRLTYQDKGFGTRALRRGFEL